MKTVDYYFYYYYYHLGLPTWAKGRTTQLENDKNMT